MAWRRGSPPQHPFGPLPAAAAAENWFLYSLRPGHKFKGGLYHFLPKVDRKVDRVVYKIDPKFPKTLLFPTLLMPLVVVMGYPGGQERHVKLTTMITYYDPSYIYKQ